jgi:hypothetical protein
MPRVNIISILGFSTRSLATVPYGTSRTSDRKADEDNEHDETVKSTKRGGVKRENCFQGCELRSTSEVRGRVFKMKSKSNTQQCVATLSKSVVKSTACGWTKPIRFLCGPAWSATVQGLRWFQGINVPALSTAPMDAAWPNPSLNRSANGRPPSPGRWYAVHFHRPGLGGLPSSPG